MTSTYGSSYLRIEQEKFAEDYKIWSNMVCLGRQFDLKFFKCCFQKILDVQILNTFTHIWISK